MADGLGLPTCPLASACVREYHCVSLLAIAHRKRFLMSTAGEHNGCCSTRPRGGPRWQVTAGWAASGPLWSRALSRQLMRVGTLRLAVLTGNTSILLLLPMPCL